IDRSMLYMRVVLFTTLVNIPLNYVFMFGPLGLPAFGVEGAGLGTLAASMLGVAYYFVLGTQHARGFGFLRVRPTVAQARLLLRLAIPGGLQQVLEMFALTLMYRIVGIVGTLELASYTVLVNLIGFVGLPAWGLGTAGATLVGQALGKRDREDAAQWAWDVIKVGCSTIAVLGAPLWIAPDLVLSAFIHEQETIEMARLPCRILGLMIVFNGVGYMLASMLNGAGDVKRVMYVNLAMQYSVLLPGAYLLGPILGYGLLGIWTVHQFGFRGGQSVIFALMWRAGRWSRNAF
ncbi:MAG: MATE family efflux transporter, partial [Gammaproteobacteria bacterium]